MAYEEFPNDTNDDYELYDTKLVAELTDAIAPHIASPGFLPTESNAFRAVSTLVCHYEGIGGKRHLYQQERTFLDEQRTRGKLRTDLLAMDDDAFKLYADKTTHELATLLADQAVEPLQHYVRDVKNVCGPEVLGKVATLGEVMGVKLVDEYPESMPRDEKRAARLVQLARRMDSGYMTYVALNPAFARTEDLEYLAETTEPRSPDLVDFLLRLNRGD